MTGTYHHAHLFKLLFIEIKSQEIFCLGWFGTVILPISFSHIVGTVSACHCAQLMVETGSPELFAEAGLKQ
jgi:hypothetical protein